MRRRRSSKVSGFRAEAIFEKENEDLIGRADEPRRSDEEQYDDLCRFLSPHLDSFNWAVTEGLKRIVNWIPHQEIKSPNGDQILKLRITEISMSKPYEDGIGEILPYACRLGGKTYGGTLQVIVETQLDNLPPEHIPVACKNIPVMVNSVLCHLHGKTPKEKSAMLEEPTEAGGYFIFNGYEKLLRLLILNRQNYVFAIKRATFKGRGSTFTEYATSIRSSCPDCSSVTTNVHYQTTGNIVVLVPIQRRMFFIPLPIILRALIEVDDKTIYQSVVGDDPDEFFADRIIATLRYCSTKDAYNSQYNCYTRHSAREYLGAFFRNVMVREGVPSHYTNQDITDHLLDRYLLPHLTCESPKAKYDLLIFMVKRLLQLVKGDILPDNMDANSSHELLTPGTLWLATLSDSLSDFLRASALSILFDTKHSLNETEFHKAHLKKKMADSVEKRMRTLFSTGSLGGKNTLGLSQTVGLSIIAERINYCRYLAHFRSVHRGQFFTTMKTTAVRYLLPESWGFMCPVHTPDGGLCGLLNHLARKCVVISGDTHCNKAREKLSKILGSCGMLPFSIANHSTVILDGRVIGSIHPHLLDNCIVELKAARREDNCLASTEIANVPTSQNSTCLYLFTNQQRMMRPVYNNETEKIEYIGPLEQTFMDISATPGDKSKPYCEVHPTYFLSLIASLTPFSDYNQSPRNMYQCQMAKQTMGYPSNREAVSTEVKTYHVHYPQRPLVRSKEQDSHALEDFLLGTNACVAVLSYTGYDMEDALIINKSSVERGFGHGCVYKTHRYFADDILTGSYFTNVIDGVIVEPSLDVNGFPYPGERFGKGQKMLRVFNPTTKETRILSYKDGETGYVDHVTYTANPDGKTINNVVIKFRMVRTPTIGDKFSSRHGQKGVFSFPWPQENMPYCENGICPDVIINPHAFPSRMTIGMLIESMCGKLSAAGACEFFDSTPFKYSEENKVTDVVGKMLAKKGFNYHGNEVMISGITGEMFKADIFFGVVYYQRLRHMVGDKYQVRATGKMNNITRQPVKGRKKGGGIRLGEMERDCLLAQGVSFLIRDRFMWCSDGHITQLCNKCGSFLFTQIKKYKDDYEETYCYFCRKSGNTTPLYVPYVLRYLCGEFAAMNIRLKFETEEELVNICEQQT